MPTLNPRLTITLDPLLAAQLRRLSELTGNSQGKLIAEILEGSTEVFARLIAVLEAAKEATADMRTKTATDLAAAQTRVERQLGLVLDDFNGTTAPLLEGVEGIKRRAKRSPRVVASGSAAPEVAASIRLPTPISNRGVRSLTSKKKVLQKGATK